jgi:flavodoxin
MNRRNFITGAGAGLVTILLGGCSFMSQNKDQQQSAAPSTTDNTNNTNVNNQNKQAIGKDKKILIAYFSYEGNTKSFAESIQKEVGGDLFFIEPQDAYPKNRDTVIDQTKGEVESKYTPKLVNKLADIRSYDIIFIGTPIWWYTVAPPVRTFLTEYDLADKTIVPFSTHKGSGLSRIDKTIQEIHTKAKVLEGFAIWDGQVNKKQADIRNWLLRLKV